MEEFCLEYKHESFTLKMHALAAHVNEFIRLWKFWGLLSEQSIEAFHCQFNKNIQKYLSFRNRDVLLMKIIRKSVLCNRLHDFKLNNAVLLEFDF